ncbi:MAG: AtaL-like protein [Formosimonas sp.]|mgnify:FL=1|jgi:hypothetical protein
MIQFTHTLAVNQPNQPALDLTQIWNGLILRIIEQPRFTPGLDRVELLEQNPPEQPTRYRRALHFGEHVVCDAVSITPQQSIEFVTEANDAAPSGRLLIEVNPDLSLTLSYATEFPEASSAEEEQLLGMVQAAYHAADVDMIRIIRECALSVRH